MNEPAVPATPRERVRQALHVTGWMLKSIDAPVDLRHWKRRDRDAWMEVVGRPRLREVMHSLMIEQAGAPEVPEGTTIDPEDTLRIP